MIEVEGLHMILFLLTRSRKDFDLRKMVLETEHSRIIVIELNYTKSLIANTYVLPKRLQTA